MDDGYFREFARKTLARMRPEQARKALDKGAWYTGGYYTAPDASLCCPFGAGLGLNPKRITDDDRDSIDFAMYSAATEAGFLDVSDDMKNPIFCKGLQKLSADDVRLALAEAAGRL